MPLRTIGSMAMVLALTWPASMALAQQDTTAAQAPESATTADAQAASPASSAGDVDAAAPASAAPALQATIRQVRGIVQYRTAQDQPWQKVQVGQTLDVGVEFRTGPRSAVTFHLPPDQLITLDRLGTLKLLQAVQNANGTQATTDLGMNYGRARYQVEGGQDVEHHATIRSPSATLAIRGTEDVTLTDQGLGRASAVSRGTRVWFSSTGRSGRARQVVFGGNHDRDQQKVEHGDSSPAEHRSRTRLVDPGNANARSFSEQSLLTQYESFNGPEMTGQGVRTLQRQAVPTAPPPATGCPCHHHGNLVDQG